MCLFSPDLALIFELQSCLGNCSLDIFRKVINSFLNLTYSKQNPWSSLHNLSPPPACLISTSSTSILLATSARNLGMTPAPSLHFHIQPVTRSKRVYLQNNVRSTQLSLAWVTLAKDTAISCLDNCHGPLPVLQIASLIVF